MSVYYGYTGTYWPLKHHKFILATCLFECAVVYINYASVVNFIVYVPLCIFAAIYIINVCGYTAFILS